MRLSPWKGETMDKQKAEELKEYIDALTIDNKQIVKHQITHVLLAQLESYHKQLHREEKGCNFHDK